MNDETKSNEEYRHVLATANKLESIQGNLESVIDFFLAPVVKLYSKLCNDCMKLLFECEFKLDYFRKAEELVWKRIYHDVYRFQKTKRHRIKRPDEHLIESHFISGIGFYSSLIIKLRTHYGIYDVQGIIEPLNLRLGPLDNFADDLRLNHHQDNSTSDNDNGQIYIDANKEFKSSLQTDWARQAIYRSLVYMGDLARYLLEISQFDYRQSAFQFYCSASRYQPNHGLPFNQLATLAGSSNHNLDAVCNYMRCCLRPKPFEGAEGNMRKLFELNRKSYEELKKQAHIQRISDVLASKDPLSSAETMMRVIIVTFIKLTSDLWTSIPNSLDDLTKENIILETKDFFETLREALDLEPIVPLAISDSSQEFRPISGGSSSLEKPRYVSSTLIHEFCSISIMLIAKCHNSKSKVDDSKEPVLDHFIDLVNTLALNLLHYSTSKCQRIVTRKMHELRIKGNEFVTFEKTIGYKQAADVGLKHSRGDLSNASQRSTDTINSLNDSTSKRTLSRLRQRKAATNYSDLSTKFKPLLNQGGEDSDMSELEETALSTIDALEISSDMSESPDYHMDDLIDLGSSSDEELARKNHKFFLDKSANPLGLSKPPVRPTKSQNFEQEMSITLANASNSLPIPDLLTGDMQEKIDFRLPIKSQSFVESLNGSDVIEQHEADGQQTGEISELDSVFSFVYTKSYLPTIKIFCDWLLSNGGIIASNSGSFRAFRAELDGLISTLGDFVKLAETKDMNRSSNETSLNACSESGGEKSLLYLHSYSGPSWVQKYPLDCDFSLMNLAPLRTVHELNIDFDCRKSLSNPEAGFVTVQCVIAFYQALTAVLDNKSS